MADAAGVRVAFSAVRACIELDGVGGRSLPPALRRLAPAANLSVSWVNDVYSWPKERALGEASNLVAVRMEQQGIGEPEAFRQACLPCGHVVQDDLQARQGVAREDRDALRLRESWMQGNLDWHAVATARYAEHLSVAPTPVALPTLTRAGGQDTSAPRPRAPAASLPSVAARAARCPFAAAS